MLGENPGTIELIDRKSYLQTVKRILSNFVANMNNQVPGAKPLALIDYVKNTTVDLMIRADDEMKKRSPRYMVHSSDSESSTGANLNRVQIFKDVVDDYLGVAAKQSSWHKEFIEARVINNFSFFHNL